MEKNNDLIIAKVKILQRIGVVFTWIIMEETKNYMIYYGKN